MYRYCGRELNGTEMRDCDAPNADIALRHIWHELEDQILIRQPEEETRTRSFSTTGAVPCLLSLDERGLLWPRHTTPLKCIRTLAEYLSTKSL